MTVVRINIDEVNGASSELESKAKEVDAAIARADNVMKNLQGGFTGKRASKSFEQWAQLQETLKQAAPSLHSAATILKNAASDFAAADGN